MKDSTQALADKVAELEAARTRLQPFEDLELSAADIRKGLMKRPVTISKPLLPPRPASSWPAALITLREDPRFAEDSIGSKVLSRTLAARAGYHLELGRPTDALQYYRWGSAMAVDPWDMIHLLRSRLEQGHRASPPRPPEGLARAERLLLSGMPDRASIELAQVLGVWPNHPRGLQLAERLYSLGHRVDRVGAAP